MPKEEGAQQAEKIVGDDSRVEIRDTRGPPYSAICTIYTRWKSGIDSLGTGVIFGERTVFTVAHNLYNDQFPYNGAAYDVMVMPGMVGGKMPYGYYSVNPDRLRLFPRTAVNDTRSSDLGAILLPEPVGRATGWCDLAPHTGLKAGDQVVVAGYPAVNTLDQLKQKLLRGQGRVLAVEHGTAHYDADVEVGQSGGPVWRATDHFPYIMTIGLHKAEFQNQQKNEFLTFDWVHYDWIQARMLESQGLPFAHLDAAVAAAGPSAYRTNWKPSAAVTGSGPVARRATPFARPPRRDRDMEGGEVETEASADKPKQKPAPPPAGKEIAFTVPKGGSHVALALEMKAGDELRGSVKVALTAGGMFTDCDLILRHASKPRELDHHAMWIGSDGPRDFRSERFSLVAQVDGPHELLFKELNKVSAALVRLTLKPR